MVCLNAHFPTKSDIKNMSYDNLALFYHFIYGDKQVCIQCTSRERFCVLVFGFVPFNYKKDNERFDTWYTAFTTKDFDEARAVYLKYVTQIIVISKKN